jgi:hypothetical protein
VGPKVAKVVRLRPLTPQQEKRLAVLRHGARLLDSAFVIPGSNVRFGLDPIFGLLPGLGDLVSPAFTLAILLQARDLGLPRVVQMRMILNVAIDALIGVVPIAGDLFDVAWKANDRNVELLERHAYEVHQPAGGDWLFVGLAVLVLAALAVIPALLLGWLIYGVGGDLLMTLG